jgi:Protein of unknown function (DUF2442)
MSISATAVRFDEHAMWVELSDGRTLGVPLAWFPRLLHATAAQRESVELSRTGLHWEDIDEDISIAGLLAGEGAAALPKIFPKYTRDRIRDTAWRSGSLR